MTNDQIGKLEDYLNGFLGLQGVAVSPVGVILVEDKDRSAVIEVITKKGLLVLRDEKSDPLQKNVEKLSDSVKEGNAVAIDARVELSPSLYNAFLDFSHGTFSVEIPGEGFTTISPIPVTAKIVFVLEKELFDASERFGKVVSSACRL